MMPEKADETFHDALDAVCRSRLIPKNSTNEVRNRRVKQERNEGVKAGDRKGDPVVQEVVGDKAFMDDGAEEHAGRIGTVGLAAEMGVEGGGESSSEQVWERLVHSARNDGTQISQLSETKDWQGPNPTTRSRNYKPTRLQTKSSLEVDGDPAFSSNRSDRLAGIEEDNAEGLGADSPTTSVEPKDDFAVLPGSPGNEAELPDDPTGTEEPDDEAARRMVGLEQVPSVARNRWRRLKHTVAFAHHVSHNIRSSAHDLLDENSTAHLQHEPSLMEDAGGSGAAAFEGAKTGVQFRPQGRKGMEGMLVRQDKGFITVIQDFYVACLKMPMGQFLLGVFLAPVLLGLLFTPVFLLDMGGLSFDGSTMAEELSCERSVTATKRRCTALINVFLYASMCHTLFVEILIMSLGVVYPVGTMLLQLHHNQHSQGVINEHVSLPNQNEKLNHACTRLSLSTTFGGSPVAARSPFSLLVANVNTLMAQFLFVFLSGAVFARMSQPSHPVRCSKKAIIRCDDFVPTSGEEKFRVFAVRLVLTGPAPCELVDAKICLTFRIFVRLPSGSMFCSTQDLELVRPEVSYLRYGIMVRHIIDKKSPVYGHNMQSLTDGDATFSLTIMALERTSMQPIFHLEDYFVCDGDVVWDGDYVDFIHINRHGHRVLDHAKIDLLKTFKVAGIVSQAITRMEGDVARRRKEKLEEASAKTGSQEELPEDMPTPRGWVGSLRARKLWKSKSTSFTRAPDW